MRQPTKYCDLVMKGGITSGLVYPSAALALAETYRFKNIGGTSAGAIAAAGCAAAALGERRRAHAPGFADRPGIGMDGLAKVAADLLKPGFLYSLFQPAPAGRAVFRLLVTWTATGSWLRRIGEAGLALTSMGWLPMLVTVLVLLGVAFVLGGWSGLTGAVLPALFCAIVAGAAGSVLVAARAVGGQFLGLCPGLNQHGHKSDALTNWLHRIIRQMAGETGEDGRPVTFGDLWTAPVYEDEPAGNRRISLELITTDVSHSQPRTLPFASRDLWFREDEFRRLFPPSVVDWMKQRAANSRTVTGIDYLALPEAADLPIVVAARMSLSFPLLISAIPLYEIDYRQPVEEDAANDVVPAETAQKGERPRLAESMDALAAGDEDGGLALADVADKPMRIVWFSDGGVSSNFPIHLFDAPLPRWPTFAIDLVYAGKGEQAPPPIFLPRHNNQALRPRYQAITGKGPLADIGAFLFGLVGTMQNWRDLLQGRAPGHRDRIVRVGLGEGEGGLNLNMPGEILQKVAEKGSDAGRELAAHFDFDNHFWVRYRNAASAVERFAISFGDGLVKPLTDDYRPAWNRMWGVPSTAGAYRFTTAQAIEAHTRLLLIEQVTPRWKAGPVDLTQGAPKPLPQLRIVPTF